MKVMKSENKPKEDIIVQWSPILGDANHDIKFVGRFAGHGAFTEHSTGDIYSIGGMIPTSKYVNDVKIYDLFLFITWHLSSEPIHIYRLRSGESGSVIQCERVNLQSSEDGKPLNFPQRWNFASVYCIKEKVSLSVD